MSSKIRYKNVYTGQEGTTTEANFKRMQNMAGFRGIFKQIETIQPKADKVVKAKEVLEPEKATKKESVNKKDDK